MKTFSNTSKGWNNRLLTRIYSKHDWPVIINMFIKKKW
jgi:hypothetical protein